MEKITYKTPVDVAKLFDEIHIKNTFEFIAKYFIEETHKREANAEVFVYPILGHKLTKKINVDYSYLVFLLSKLVDDDETFIDDFGLTDMEDTAKNNIFLVHSILESLLELVKMNSSYIKVNSKRGVNYKPSYYVPLIAERDGVFAQVGSVTFSKNAFKEYLDSELFERFIELVFNGFCSQVDGVYGYRQCVNFWKESGRKTCYVATI